MSLISSNIKSLDIKEGVAQILEKNYALNVKRNKPNISIDPKMFLNYYIKTKEVLNEFGYTDEEVIANNFDSIWSANLKMKCLIFENFHILNDVLLFSKDSFKHSVDILYARSSYYNFLVRQNDEEIKKTSLSGFINSTPDRLKEKFNITDVEMIEMFPLTSKKKEMMERIHKAKINAKNKSGGVSL